MDREPRGGGPLTAPEEGTAPRGAPSGSGGGAPVPLHCLDCPMWYGAEDDGWGPCSIKHQRGDVRFLTFGGHLCDEGYVPPPNATRGTLPR